MQGELGGKQRKPVKKSTKLTAKGNFEKKELQTRAGRRIVVKKASNKKSAGGMSTKVKS